MSKYSDYTAQVERARFRKREIHPVWRGIGFILVVLTPVLAFFGSLLILQLNAQNGWIAIPKELLAKGVSDSFLYVKIFLTITLSFLIYAIFLLFTFILYSIVAPPRYGPLDAPQPRFRGKAYRR